METHPGRTKTGFHRAGRILLAVGSFIGSFVVISHVMILFGAEPVEANAGGLICGLAVLAYVMHFPPRA
jgi:hypothetical protein